MTSDKNTLFVLSANRQTSIVSPQRISEIEAYVGKYFVSDGDGVHQSAVCTYNDFRWPSQSGASHLIDSRPILGVRLDELSREERSIATRRFKALWDVLPNSIKVETERQKYLTKLAEPLSQRLGIQSQTSTAAATFLGMERLLQYKAGLGEKKLLEAIDLLTFAAKQGDPEASYLLATKRFYVVSPADNKRDWDFASFTTKYLCNPDDRQSYLDWAIKCGFRPAIDHDELEKNQTQYRDDLILEEVNEEFDSIEKSIEKIRPLAESGQIDAQFELGKLLENSYCAVLRVAKSKSDLQGNKKRINESNFWFEKAASSSIYDNKYLSSQNKHYLGSRTLRYQRPNTDIAFNLLHSAVFSENGEIYYPALVDLAVATAQRGDIKIAEDYLRDAIRQQIDGADVELALQLISRKDVSIEEIIEARSLLYSAAKRPSQRNGDVALKAGLMFLRGEGGDKDLQIAEEMFRIAALNERSLGLTLSLTCVAAELASLLSCDSDFSFRRKENVVEILTRWLHNNKYLFYSAFPVKLNDLESYLKLKEITRESTIDNSLDGLDGFFNSFPSVYGSRIGIDRILKVFLQVTNSQVIVWKEVDHILIDDKSMVGFFLKGQLALTGRSGVVDAPRAQKYFEMVEELALGLESHQGIGPNELKSQAFFSWLRSQSQGSIVLAKNVQLQEKNEQLLAAKVETDRANQELELAKTDLEDMMAMFAHKFRGPVDSIIANAEHYTANRDHLFKDLGRTMNGLLDIFSFVSSHSEMLLPRLRKDNDGPHTLKHVVHKSLWLAIVQLLAKRNVDRMNMLYFNYAKREQRIPPGTTFSSWRKDKAMRDVREAIRSTWEIDIGGYGDFEDLDSLLVWCGSKFMNIQVIGVKESDIHFSDSGSKESLLLVILTEMLINAIKHYDPVSAVPLVLSWEADAELFTFACSNPTSSEARTRGEGSGRGLKFLALIATNVKGKFVPPSQNDEVRAAFSFPKFAFQ